MNTKAWSVCLGNAVQALLCGQFRVALEILRGGIELSHDLFEDELEESGPETWPGLLKE